MSIGLLLLMAASLIAWYRHLNLPMPSRPTRTRQKPVKAPRKAEIDVEVEKFALWLRGVSASDFDFPERLSQR